MMNEVTDLNWNSWSRRDAGRTAKQLCIREGVEGSNWNIRSKNRYTAPVACIQCTAKKRPLSILQQPCGRASRTSRAWISGQASFTMLYDNRMTYPD